MNIPARLYRLFRCAVLMLGPALLPDTAKGSPGGPDVTFNPAGVGSPPGTLRGFPIPSVRLSKVAAQPDGRMVILGSVDSELALLRLMPDGSPDPEFGNGGMAQPSISGLQALWDVKVQGDGKIVVAAFFLFQECVVLRFLPDGSLDPDFGSGGISRPDPSGYRVTLVPLSDGKLAGGGYLSGGPSRLWRLLPNGSLDPAFGISGLVELPGEIAEIAAQPDGKLVGAGFSPVLGRPHLQVARVDAAGMVDIGFGDSGKVVLPHFLSGAHSVHLALADDGKIVVTSAVPLAVVVESLRVDRLLPDGRPDLSFGPGGHVQTDNSLWGIPRGAGIHVQPGGGVVMGGVANGADFTLVRLQPDGQPDERFGTAFGTAQFHFPGGQSNITGMAALPDGSVLLAGEIFTVPLGPALVRFNGKPLPADLSAEWPAGHVLTSAATVSLSGVRGGPSAPEAEIVLRNTGTVLLTNLSAALAGPGANRFTLPGTLPAVLAPGASSSVTVRFLPAATVSAAQAALVIRSGHPDREELGVLLRGDTLLAEAVLSLFEGPAPVFAGGTLDFGATVETVPVTKVLTVKNTGNIDLALQSLTFAGAGNPGDFSAGPPERDTLAPGTATTFPVTFRPGGPGERTARLRIASTDTLHPPHEINLSGRTAEGLDAWRLTWFGTLNSELAGELRDPDHDGIPNLLEYIALSNPLKPGAFPGELIKIGDTLEYKFTRVSSAPPLLHFSLEWTDSPADEWTSLAGDPVIVSDDGVQQLVKYSLPAGESGRRFVRLRVTRR